MGGFKGGERAPRFFDTQQQAIDAGQQMAKQGRGELLIHGENGRICARDSHDNDPCPLKRVRNDRTKVSGKWCRIQGNGRKKCRFINETRQARKLASSEPSEALNSGLVA